MQNKICIGTMLWGTRTTQEDAHAIIQCALDNGIRFFDTAEKYPTFPYTDETFGNAERILGNWIKSNGRNSLEISTKAKAQAHPVQLTQLLDDSLRRLGVDYIDYYQLHWPIRGSYCFRANWTYTPYAQDTAATIDLMHTTLEVLTELIKQGKIRQIGMSNETAWGITKWNQIAKDNGFSRLSFTQNEYSLLHRIFDLDVAEACHHENVKLLAWSPLAGGLLTGKYSKDHTPVESRRSYGGLGPKDNEHVWPAVDSYKQLANTAGIDLAHLSLAWITSMPAVKAAIIGATNAAQLSHNLKFTEVELTQELLDAISEIYRKYPIPF